MAHTFTNLLTHVIFSTKNRLPHIDAELKVPLLAYMGGIVRELHGAALTINGTADHVHLLVRLPPTISLADAMRVLKTNSSRWVHEKRSTPRSGLWVRSSCPERAPVPGGAGRWPARAAEPAAPPAASVCYSHPHPGVLSL